MPAGSAFSTEAKRLKTGEILVDILKTSEIPIIASKQGDGDNGSPGPQNTFFMAPRAGEGTWARKTNMSMPRSGFSTSVVDGIIYAIGGRKLFSVGGTELSTVEAYDPVTDTWTEKSDMPTAIEGLSTSVLDGIIYAIGGYANGSQLPTVEAYDPKKDTWTPKADMPTARDWLSTSVVDGVIYAFGGYIFTGENQGFSLRTVEAYNPVTDTWTEKTDMPTARCVLSTSIVNGRVYAIGGWTSAPTAVVEEYDPGLIAVGPTGKLPTRWGDVKSD
jgi:N-acetylneuraminic acid mutarotase